MSSEDFTKTTRHPSQILMIKTTTVLESKVTGMKDSTDLNLTLFQIQYSTHRLDVVVIITSTTIINIHTNTRMIISMHISTFMNSHMNINTVQNINMCINMNTIMNTTIITSIRRPMSTSRTTNTLTNTCIHTRETHGDDKVTKMKPWIEGKILKLHLNRSMQK